jgi:peptidoglycan/LPS O-acetylase OafA/YrhL
VTSRPPAAVRRAGLLVAAEGVAALVVAVILVTFGVLDRQQKIAFGTAGWFLIIGGGVVAAGWALFNGRRWGRGLAVFAQLLLLPTAWAMAVSSHRPAYGIPVGVVAIGTLALLFSPAALRWASGADVAHGRRPASSDSAGPDTR